MIPFKYIEHTAEAGFRAYGKTLEEAFSNAAMAMINLTTDVKKVKTLREEKIEVSAATKEDLIVDFLTEILFLMEVARFLPSKITDLKIEEKPDSCRLKAVIKGDEIKNYETHGQVKAVTYHELKIEKEDGNFVVQIIVDV